MDKRVKNSDSLERLTKIVSCSYNIVFFGGAGVSTESNIPDFRSNKNGIYNQMVLAAMRIRTGIATLRSNWQK